MKTIKIFLASSEELKEERLVFADLILQLNQLFKGRDINLELVKWEYLDSSMGAKHKQEEYNEKLRDCDMCLVMFWQRFGQYTEMELDTAYDRMTNGLTPKKIYVFFKKENTCDNVSAELKAFKDIFVEKYGHFPCTFENPDTMRLEFLLQLENYQNHQLSISLDVSNEKVLIDKTEVASINKVSFIYKNEDYQKMQDELQQLRTDIEQKRFNLEEKKKTLETIKGALINIPESMHAIMLQTPKQAVNETIDELQILLDKKNALQKEYEELQKNLFNTARRITGLRGRRISERMQRAIRAFEHGEIHTANIILAEAEHDAENNLREYKLAKAEAEQKRFLLLRNIDELALKASTLLADVSIPIVDRIKMVDNIYTETLKIAKVAECKDDKLLEILWNYADFLNLYGKFNKAIECTISYVQIAERIWGYKDKRTSGAYNNLGVYYFNIGKYEDALKYYGMALEIRECTKDVSVAESYGNIGGIYEINGKYQDALRYFQKELEIKRNIIGEESPNTAIAYFHLGVLYSSLKDPDNELKYQLKALSIREKTLPSTHPDIAESYNGCGCAYLDNNDNEKALILFQKAIRIYGEMLGLQHPRVADVYNNIGNIYLNQKNYQLALENYHKSLDIYLKTSREKHSDTARGYGNIGLVYHNLNEYDKALEYYFKALDILAQFGAKGNPQMINLYDKIGCIYYDQKKYKEALQSNLNELRIIKEFYDEDNQELASLYIAIGILYSKTADEITAEHYFMKGIEIYEKLLGLNHLETADSYDCLGLCYRRQHKYEEAIKSYKKSLKIRETLLGFNDISVIKILVKIGNLYHLSGDDYHSCIYFEQAADNGDLQAMNLLGNIYGIKQDYTNAFKWLFKAAESGYKIAYNGVAWTLHLLNRSQEALPWALKAVEALNEDPNVFNTLATIYQDLGQNDKALESLEKCLELKEKQKIDTTKTIEKINSLKNILK